jgi:hypothetical protein
VQAIAYGAVAGASAWTWQLVSDTTFDDVKRAELLELERLGSRFRNGED